MKYKELPAFETNEFQRGDKFIGHSARDIHQFTCIDDGTISDVTTEKLDVITGERVDGNSTFRQLFHFRQCIKLEPVEPREYWLCTNCKFAYQMVKSPIDCCSEGEKIFPIIKVREVPNED